MKKLLAIIILLFSLLLCTSAQQNIVSDFADLQIVPNYTDMKVINSKINNDNYFLYLKLPKDYNESNRSYPVIYLLDGDIAFTMAWSTIRYLQFGRHVPDVIIVGIGYGSLLSSDAENMRERDYSISEIEGRDFTGGGVEFLKVLETEIIPFIDSKYRTDPAKRILNGYSFGGLFTMFTFVTKNDLFSSYVAGSPYLLYDIEELQKLVNENSEMLKKSNAKLFVSYGSLEDEVKYIDPINNIVKSIEKVEFNKSNILKREFEGGSHFTCPSEAMVYGIKYIFE